MYISVYFDTIVSCLLIKCCKYFVFMLVDFGSFHSRVDNVINDSFNYTVTRHRRNCQELKYRIFRSVLIHVLAHFQRTTCSQIYFRFSSYLLRKPHTHQYVYVMCTL
jgi:hypothetical protein